MRLTIPQIAITDNLPDCPACGAPTVFTHTADIARDNRVYFIFRCQTCSAGETKVWRLAWQTLSDSLVTDDD